MTGEDVRRGLENLNLDAARFKALGLDGFAGAAQDHLRRPQQPSADLRAAVGRREMGEGQRLVAPDTAKVQPLLEEAAKAYAEKNAGWPTRTEPCDNK